TSGDVDPETAFNWVLLKGIPEKLPITNHKILLINTA
ncbi:unnamed protein product, partial [marine sediment metagenome]